MTCFGPAFLWMNRHETGAVPAQTRTPKAGIVDAVGGGFTPTHLKGGGAGDSRAAVISQAGGRAQ
jgi:hypothetical protein